MDLVWDWIDDLGSTPDQHPSTQIEELSDSESEVRTAVVPHTETVYSYGVEAFYRHSYGERATDLIYVRTDRRAGELPFL